MKYTYPAVFYQSEEYGDYAVEFSDIAIYAEGDTMEDAYQNAQKYLLKYLEVCDELDAAPNEPNTFEEMQRDSLKRHPNGRVMLVTVEYERKDKSQDEREFASLGDDIVEDIEQGLEEGENPALDRYIKREVIREIKDDDGDDDFGLPEID